MDKSANSDSSMSAEKIKSRSKLIPGLILLSLGALFFAYLEYRFKMHIWDDAYITFRHSLNMARGYGLVYNPGEQVDAITNYLLAWILGHGLRAGIEPEPLSRVIGIASSWIILLGIWFFVRIRLKMPPIYAGLSVLLLSTFGSFAMESMGGLETCLFALFIMWLLWEITSSKGKDLSSFCLIRAGIASGLAMLTRPDAAFFIFAAMLLLVDRNNIKASIRRIIIYSIPILALFMPYFIWHWTTYGYPFPNSYYAKQMGSIHLFSKGFETLYSNLRDIGFLIMVFLLAFLIACGTKLQKMVQDRDYLHVVLAITLFFIARLVFILSSGGEWIGWGRFMVPAIPCFVLLFLIMLKEIENLPQKKTRANGIILIFVLMLIGNNLWHASDFLTLTKHPSLQLDRAHIPIGIALGDILSDDETISFGDAGVLPYVGDLVNIDPAGLCDQHIAHLPGDFNWKTDPGYIIDRKPSVIILNSINPPPEFNPQSPIDNAIVRYPRLLEEYSFMMAFKAWEGYNLWLFGRKDRADEISNELMQHPALAHFFTNS